MGLAYLAAPGSGYPLVVLGPALPSRSLGSLFFAARREPGSCSA